MTDVKFSGIHELENPEPVALSYSKQIGKIPVWCVGSAHTVSFDWFLSGLEKNIYLGVLLLKLLLFYEQIL